MSCLFCDNPLDNSDEHIIPDSLNGRLHSRNIICYACNSNIFGEHLDPIGKEFFNPILLALDFKNAQGKHFEDLDGEKYLVRKGGEISQVRPKIERIKVGNKELISVSGPPKHTIKQYNKIAEKLTSEGKKSLKFEKKEIVQNVGPLRVDAKFEISPKLVLLLNKIAIEFYGLKWFSIEKIKPLVKRIRDLDSAISNVRFDNFNQEIRSFKDDEISHLIKLISNDRKLYTYIELFNIVCAAVLIDDEYEGENVDIQYYQNAITGNEIDETVELDKDVIEKLFESEDQDYSKVDFNPLINRVFKSKQGQDVSKEINERITKLDQELRRKLDLNQISRKDYEEEMLKKGTEIIAQTTVDNPYLFDDIDDEHDYRIHYIYSNVKEEDYEEFCKLNNNLIGLKIMVDDKFLFKIVRFEKVPVIKKNGVQIVRVNVIVHNGIRKERIPYREVFELIENFSQVQKKNNQSNKKPVVKRKKKKLRKGKGLRIANKKRKIMAKKRREKRNKKKKR
ncbi:MAG: hypothetical protein KIPDCIKN_04182 [Haliscomenobacter sp.]|nr:hypothetical protein [Haliscomenobacter sp.]